LPFRLSLATLTLCLLFAAAPARAMQFTQESVGSTEIFLVARGPIVKDDAVRLEKALSAVPPLTRILALALDSPGGLVSQGEQLSRIIRSKELTVVVAADRQCVSACFLLFAASPRKYVESNALVGVHSASENGTENETTMAVSVQMARIASALGVPPAVVGKMVRTKPGAVEWLTPEDLTSMGAKTYTGDIVTAIRETSGARVAGSVTNVPIATLPPLPVFHAPVFAPPPAPTATSSNGGAGFAAGRNGRTDWDRWLANQPSEFRDGAVLASLQSGLASGMAICHGPNGTDWGDLTMGCETALQRLAGTEPNRRMDPDYAAGWNSQVLPTTPPQAIEAQYRGAYFCGRQIASLTVQIFRRSNETTRRALFVFGPQATSPSVPRGAFVVQGSFDPASGALQLRPVKWASQPSAYAWFGLDGRTTDNGTTFSGRVTENNGCSQFTLKRADGPR
jgi:hypothetical protein